jgi:hypothetical protein
MASVYHAAQLFSAPSPEPGTLGASRVHAKLISARLPGVISIAMRALPAPLETSLILLLASFAPACSSGAGDDEGFTTFSSFTTQPTTTMTTLGDGDGDAETSSSDNGDGDGDTNPGDGDGDTDPSDGGDVCGDGVVGPTESCDGSELAGETCMSQGFEGGTLGCSVDCNDFDVAGCTSSSCGNGVIDMSELCDGPQLNGQTCASVGFAGGELACNPNCLSFNVSGCVEAACGNGVIEQGETCDGNNLNGQSCASQGYAGGSLVCNGSCTGYEITGCNDGDCCAPHGYTGCQVAFISNCVCGLDPFCCNTEWDQYCVDEAIVDCGAAC